MLGLFLRDPMNAPPDEKSDFGFGDVFRFQSHKSRVSPILFFNVEVGGETRRYSLGGLVITQIATAEIPRFFQVKCLSASVSKLLSYSLASLNSNCSSRFGACYG